MQWKRFIGSSKKKIIVCAVGGDSEQELKWEHDNGRGGKNSEHWLSRNQKWCEGTTKAQIYLTFIIIFLPAWRQTKECSVRCLVGQLRTVGEESRFLLFIRQSVLKNFNSHIHRYKSKPGTNSCSLLSKKA